MIHDFILYKNELSEQTFLSRRRKIQSCLEKGKKDNSEKTLKIYYYNEDYYFDPFNLDYRTLVCRDILERFVVPTIEKEYGVSPPYDIEQYFSFIFGCSNKDIPKKMILPKRIIHLIEKEQIIRWTENPPVQTDPILENENEVDQIRQQ